MQWSKGRGRLVGGHGRASQRSWGVCSQRTPSHHAPKTVENLSRLGCAQNGRQDIIRQKSGRPSEAGRLLAHGTVCVPPCAMPRVTRLQRQHQRAMHPKLVYALQFLVVFGLQDHSAFSARNAQTKTCGQERTDAGEVTMLWGVVRLFCNHMQDEVICLARVRD
jgi:hypothetical protein